MAASVAIVFIHSGDSDYLCYSLAQARRSNPKSAVYLIGDEATAGKYAVAEHIPYRGYVEDAKKFAASYRHLNTNAHAFELFCMMRWFVLRDFMRHKHIETAVYLDSDIMLYEEMHYEHFRYYDYDLAVTGVAPPVLVNNIKALEAFCSLMSGSYTDPVQLKSLEERFRIMQARGIAGGICDMTFWEMFMTGDEFRVADLALQTDGALYDRNIILGDGFEMENGLKSVVWHGDKPYGISGKDRSLVRFKGLHFHGPTKELMGNYIAGPDRPGDDTQ